MLDNLLPVVSRVKEHGTLPDLTRDLRSGLTLAFLAIPQCMAYAIIAKLPPIYGLYAGIVTAIVGGLFMTSRHMVTGPTATVSLIVAGIVLELDLPAETVVIYLALLVGLFQVLFYLLNIGNLARFVSDAVVSGFVMGSACVIIGGQFLSLLGAPEARSSYFFVRVYHGLTGILQDPAHLHELTLLVGGVTVVSLAMLRYLSDRLPSSLLLLLVGAIATWAFNLEQHGLQTVGSLPSLIPTLTLPSAETVHVVETMFSSAFALALFCSVQSISVSKSIATQNQDTINENKELLGQGLANVSAGLLSGYPVGASFSRSFLNSTLGAKTQLSCISCGVFVAILTALASSLIEYVPIAVLAGIIMVVVAEVIEIEEAQIVWASTMQDRVAFLSTFLGVLFLTLDFAIYLGVAVSLVFYLREATRLDLKEYILDPEGNLKHITSASEREDPMVAVIDVNGEAFFGAADQIKERVTGMCNESDDLRVVILRMKNVTNFDVTGAAVIKSIARDLKQMDKTLMLCGTTPRIREILDEAAVADEIGQDKIMVAQKDLLESTRSALDRAQNHIDEVLEGTVDREEEEPSLEHTMEDLENDQGNEKEQDPIEHEKHTTYDENREPEEG